MPPTAALETRAITVLDPLRPLKADVVPKFSITLFTIDQSSLTSLLVDRRTQTVILK